MNPPDDVEETPPDRSPPGPWSFEPLQAFIRLAEHGGAELPVSLLIGGREVYGYLTPYSRFGGFLEELRDMVQNGNRQELPAMEAGPISREEAEAIHGEWADQEPEELAELEYATFVVRDATIRTGVPAAAVQRNFLVVKASSVDAVSLGVPS